MILFVIYQNHRRKFGVSILSEAGTVFVPHPDNVLPLSFAHATKKVVEIYMHLLIW